MQLPGELARLSGRRKQTIGAILDDLERLGYVGRQADPQDRRASLIVPTDRGLTFMHASDAIISKIESQHAVRIGPGAYAQLKDHLRTIASPDAKD